MKDRAGTVSGGGPGISSDLEEKQGRLWRVLTPVLLSLQLLLVYTGVELGLARQDSRWLPAVRAETLADYTGLWPDQPEREPLSPEIIGEIIADEMVTDPADPSEEDTSQEEREAAAESLLDATPVPVTPTPTPSPTPTPGAGVSEVFSPTATATPSHTPTPTPSRTPRPSATVTSTPSTSPTPTASRTPTPSPTVTITVTGSSTPPSDCIAGGEFEIAGKEVRWDLTNHCASDLTITQLYINWPASNQRLNEVKLGGSTIWKQEDTTPPTTISSGWTEEPVVEAGDADTLKFKFKKSAAAGPYQISVTFSNAQTLSISVPDPNPTPTATPTKTPVATAEAAVPANTPAPSATAASSPTPSCWLSGYGQSGEQVFWSLTNGGPSGATVVRIFLDWPAGNDELKKIELGGNAIWDREDDTPPTEINSGWKGGASRSLGPSESKPLAFQFDEQASPSGYWLQVSFDNGCVASASA